MMTTTATTDVRSFYMSRVHRNMSMETIANTFEKLGLCIVSRIEWRPFEEKEDKQNGVCVYEKTYYTFISCFVFVEEWFDTPYSVSFREQLTKKNENEKNYAKVIHNEYTGAWWDIFRNISKISSHPIPKHMDIYFVIPVDTTEEKINAVLEELDLGKVVSMEVKCVFENGMKGMMVCFDYWYRTMTAVLFQEEMFFNKCVSKEVDDGVFWNFYEVSETLTTGYNPFIWFNLEIFQFQQKWTNFENIYEQYKNFDQNTQCECLECDQCKHFQCHQCNELGYPCDKSGYLCVQCKYYQCYQCQQCYKCHQCNQYVKVIQPLIDDLETYKYKYFGTPMWKMVENKIVEFYGEGEEVQDDLSIS